MTYKLIATDEMNRLLEKCTKYLINTLKSRQAAQHLLDGVEKIYSDLEYDPEIYRISQDPFMEALQYREAKIPEMNYMIIYRISGEVVYLLGIFHTLENYGRKIRILWNTHWE